MSQVQLFVQRENYVRELTVLLAREGCEVVRPVSPDFESDGAIVADRSALERYPELLHHPERVVLIAPNEPNFLSLLWKHKMRSVVFETDPPGTVVLAILGTEIGHGRLGAMAPSKSTLVTIGSPR